MTTLATATLPRCGSPRDSPKIVRARVSMLGPCQKATSIKSGSRFLCDAGRRLRHRGRSLLAPLRFGGLACRWCSGHFYNPVVNARGQRSFGIPILDADGQFRGRPLVWPVFWRWCDGWQRDGAAPLHTSNRAIARAVTAGPSTENWAKLVLDIANILLHRSNAKPDAGDLLGSDRGSFQENHTALQAHGPDNDGGTFERRWLKRAWK